MGKATRIMTEEEWSRLAPVQDVASNIWGWVASYIAYLAKDEYIPGPSSGAVMSLMDTVKEAQGGLRSVRNSLLVQVPYVYAHMLSMLVHLNNLLCAVHFGCILGVHVHPIVDGLLPRFFAGHNEDMGWTAKDKESATFSIFFAFVTDMTAPFMYL